LLVLQVFGCLGFAFALLVLLFVSHLSVLVLGSKKESEQPQFLLSFCSAAPSSSSFSSAVGCFGSLADFGCCLWNSGFIIKGFVGFSFSVFSNLFSESKYSGCNPHNPFGPEICAVVVLRWISGSQGERDSETCEQQFWWSFLLEEENARRVRFKDCAC